MASLPLGEAGAIDAPLPAAMAATVYSRVANWPVILASLTLLGGLLARKHRQGA